MKDASHAPGNTNRTLHSMEDDAVKNAHNVLLGPCALLRSAHQTTQALTVPTQTLSVLRSAM